MGTINFGTLTNIDRLALVNEPETEDEELYCELVEETQAQLDKLNLYYFSLSIEYGYYEGFYLKLNEENTKYIYANTKEKQEVLKELTAIKNILIELVKDNFLIGCYPSWVTTRLKTAETIKQIKSIIKELKAETMASYTEYKANKENKSIFDIVKEYGTREGKPC